MQQIQPLKVGIVGMGGIGWVHAKRYLQLPTAEITALADLVPERTEPRRDIQYGASAASASSDLTKAVRFGEGMDLIRNADVDVIDICLPTYLHAAYTIAALEAGRHVICEKPMALSAEEGARMVKAAEQANRLLMVAQVIRFWPEYQFLREAISRGVYGTLRSLNIWRTGGWPRWSSGNWYLDPRLSGGALLDLHIHDVDYIQSILGWPDRILATARISERATSYDVIHAIYCYDQGPQVHMYAGWTPFQTPFGAGFDAWFDRAFLRYSQGRLIIFDSPDRIISREVPVPPGDGYLNEIAYFLDCVIQGTQPELCSPESTRDSLALIRREIQAIEQT